MAFVNDGAPLLTCTQSLPVDKQEEARYFSVPRRGSITSGGDTMSYYSEGELSHMGSLESVSTSYSNTRAQAYGAVAMSPTGDTSRVVLNEYDAFSLNVTCSHCQQKVMTKTQHKCGRLTFLSSAVLGVLCCGLGCFIPFCVKSLKDVTHECPNCEEVLGVYKRSTSCTS